MRVGVGGVGVEILFRCVSFSIRVKFTNIHCACAIVKFRLIVIVKVKCKANSDR